MPSPFLLFFKQAMVESIGASYRRNQEECEAYRDLAARQAELLKEIQDKLGQDTKLILRFEETGNEKASYEEEWIYRQGFSDCLELLRWADAFSPHT